MLYLVHAYEEFYSGLHGIEDYEIVELEEGNENVLDEIGTEMSIAIMDSFDIYENYGLDEDSSDDEVEEAIAENVSYDLYRITEPGMTQEEAEEWINSDPTEFIELYCETY